MLSQLRATNGAGFTLLEVLVALIVLSMGVIGAAGSQLSSLRVRHGAALTSTAVQLGTSLAERMRANAGLTQGFDAANPYLRLDYDGSRGAPSAPPALCYANSVCDAAQLAQFDLYEVMHAVHARFPGGRITLCRDNVVWDSAGAALAWPCAGGASAPLVIKIGWRARDTATLDVKPVAPLLAMVVGGASQ